MGNIAKAIKTIKHINFCGACTTGDCHSCEKKIARNTTISALAELEKYREIGTIEECRNAMKRCAG